MHAGINRLELDLTGLTDLAAIQAAVSTWAGVHPGDGWIVGRCYEPIAVPGGIGRADWLDAVCADRPVALFPNDNHSVWVNTTAMRLAGVAADTPDPPLGEIVRDGDGTPVGSFLEFGGIDVFRHLLPTPTDAMTRAGLVECMQAMSAAGIVWAQDASVRLDELEVYASGARDGLLTCRVNAAFRADPALWPRQRGPFGEARRAIIDDPGVNRMVTANTVKFFADGVIESGTGFLVEPYTDAPHTCGLPNWSPDGLSEAVRAFDADGFQIHIHAIGDGGVRMALDAIEHATATNGRRDRRAVIAHTQLVHAADKPRFAALGVIANFEPLWAAYDEFMHELTLPRLGPERTALQYPIGSLLAGGARISFGSDWPVSSHRPLEGLAVAVTRANRRGEPIGGWVPEERVPMLRAIEAYTRGSAYQAFDDDAGSLSVGQRADLVITDCDVTAIAGEDLAEVEVTQTWLDGTPVFVSAQTT